MHDSIDLALPTGIILGLHIACFVMLIGLAAFPLSVRGRLIVLFGGLLIAVLLPFLLIGDLLFTDFGPDGPVLGVPFYNYFALSFLLPILATAGTALILVRRPTQPGAGIRAMAGILCYAVGFGVSLLVSVSDALPSTVANYLSRG